MIQEVEEEEPTGFIRFEKFQPMMARVLMERRYVHHSHTHTLSRLCNKALVISWTGLPDRHKVM